MKDLVVISMLMALFATAAVAGELLPLTEDEAAMPGEFLVIFGPDVRAGDVAPALARTHGARVERTWEHALSGALMSGLDPDRALAMSANIAVELMEPNKVVRLAISTEPAPGLDRGPKEILKLAGSFTGHQGYGVHVYVLDSGLSALPAELGDRASIDFDATGDGLYGEDCNGHGTGVAATIGGATRGLAPEVTLHGVRVLDCQGSGTLAAVIDGVEWVSVNHVAPAVASLDFATGASKSLAAAIESSIEAGVFYAVMPRGDNDDDDVFGAPYVAAIAALILDEDPGRSPQQVHDEIIAIAGCDRGDTIATTGVYPSPACACAVCGSDTTYALCGAELGVKPAGGLSLKTIVYEKDFEDGNIDWSTTGQWGLVEDSPCFYPEPGYSSADHAMYFGNDSSCTYGSAETAGNLTSPWISGITASTTITFDYIAHLGSGAELIAKIRERGSGTWTTAWSTTTSKASWTTIDDIDLSDYAGETIKVRLYFTVDPLTTDRSRENPVGSLKWMLKHSNHGWGVDNIVISR